MVHYYVMNAKDYYRATLSINWFSLMNYSSLHITTNFHIIKKWIEERDGMPARVHGNNKELTTLRVFYPNIDASTMQIIPWSEFFDEFAQLNLAFMYQLDVVVNEHARFYKFVAREDYIDELVEEEDEEDMRITQKIELLHL